jgi:hypothetical protein
VLTISSKSVATCLTGFSFIVSLTVETDNKPKSAWPTRLVDQPNVASATASEAAVPREYRASLTKLGAFLGA